MKYAIDPSLIISSRKFVAAADIDLLRWEHLNTSYGLLPSIISHFFFIRSIDRYRKSPNSMPFVIVTGDSRLRKVFGRKGIKCIDLSGFRMLNDKIIIADRELQLRNWERSSAIYSFGRIAAAYTATTIFTALFIFSIQFLPDIVQFLPAGMTYVLIPVVGLMFFLWRQRGRLYYGFFETIIGIYTPIHAVSNMNYHYTQLGVLEYVQIIGGIYVIVRGLDNIGKGLEKYPAVLKWWRKVFS